MLFKEYLIVLLIGMFLSFNTTFAKETKRMENLLRIAESITNLPPEPPLPFDLNRTFTCVKETVMPEPTEQALIWFKAAMVLLQRRELTTRGITTEEHIQMQILFEGAARLGYWKAVNNLALMYMNSNYSKTHYFAQDLEKVHYWMNYSFEQKWSIAYGLVAQFKGTAEYMQLAAEKGDAGAQYSLSEMHSSKGIAATRVSKERPVLPTDAHSVSDMHNFERRKLQLCAADNDRRAAYWMGVSFGRDKNYPEAMRMYHFSIKAGGDDGGMSAFRLWQAFKGDSSFKIQTDPARMIAYREIEEAINGDGTGKIKGNRYLTFPLLDTVLPLPPAQMPEWKGIESAMHPLDVKFMKTPPDFKALVNEVNEMKLIPENYFTEPEILKTPRKVY